MLSFSQAYINNADGRQRTADRNAIIEAEALRRLNKVKTCGCPDWYLDTLLELVRMENKKQKYVLKAGALLAIPFGDESLTCVNANLTDELAELHIGLDKRKMVLFEVAPDKVPTRKRLLELMDKYGVSESHLSENSVQEPVGNKKPAGNKPEAEKPEGDKPEAEKSEGDKPAAEKSEADEDENKKVLE